MYAYKKVLEVIVRHINSMFMLSAIKDSWIDIFIQLLYVTGTDEFIDRKLREEGYVRKKCEQYSRRESMRKINNYWDKDKWKDSHADEYGNEDLMYD